MTFTTNIICWVSAIDKNNNLIHMCFDPNENEYEKLKNMTANYTRKRLSKNGFSLNEHRESIFDELNSIASKKIKIKIIIKPYNIADKNNPNERINGCTFLYNGLVD